MVRTHKTESKNKQTNKNLSKQKKKKKKKKNPNNNKNHGVKEGLLIPEQRWEDKTGLSRHIVDGEVVKCCFCAR